MGNAKRETVVVCGATGYLGGEVTKALAAAGYPVRVLARDRLRLGSAKGRTSDVFEGEATRAESLAGLFDGASIAFSSIGIRHMKRKPTFWEVDRDANLNLVQAAKDAGVKTFIFVSVFRAPELRDKLPVADARETVVDAIRSSGMNALVLRPTGFFNDMGEMFDMAKGGRVWLIGSGETRINPIHGADIGAEIIMHLERGIAGIEEQPIGGPDTVTFREIGDMAFRVLGKPAKFSSIPGAVMSAVSAIVTPFNANAGTLFGALGLMASSDAVAPAVGDHHLAAYFDERARALNSG